MNDVKATVTSLAIPISSSGNYVQYDESRSQYPIPGLFSLPNMARVSLEIPPLPVSASGAERPEIRGKNGFRRY